MWHHREGCRCGATIEFTVDRSVDVQRARGELDEWRTTHQSCQSLLSSSSVQILPVGNKPQPNTQPTTQTDLDGSDAPSAKDPSSPAA